MIYICRVTSQSRNKKELILNAALELFVENDIDKTSTLSIAKKAEVSNGTLFHYFPTKNDLIIELYLTLKTEMFDFVYSNDLKNINSLKNMIKVGSLNAILWITQNKQKHSYIHKIYKSNYKNLIDDDELPDNYKYYLKTLKKGIENKTLLNIPVELMANIINNHVSSLAEYYISSGNEISLELNEKIINMTWNSLKIESNI